MATYGKFEALGEIAHNSRGSVFLARPAGTSKPLTYTVKVFEPVVLPGLASSDRTGARKFLEAAEAQRLAAGKRAKHWAPIFELGDFPGGAFYVTQHYPRSLEKLIDGRLVVSSETMVHVMRSLVRALKELEKRAGRAHGNLKATNVFFSGSGPLQQSRLIVSDPLSSTELAAVSGLNEDLNALGTLIFRLVRRRDVRGPVSWPVTESPDWDILGAKSERWRELCNTLLDPRAATNGLTLDEVDKQVDALRFRGARKRVFAGAIGIPALTVFSAFLYLRFASYERLPERFIDLAEMVGNAPPDLARPPEEWALLCNATYDWFGSLQSALKDPARRAAWQRDPILAAQEIARLDDAADRSIEIDPRELLDTTVGLQSLVANPPDAVKRGAMPYRIQRAWKIVQEMRAALQTWPVPARLRETADRYAALGWTAPADELKRRLGDHDKSQHLTAEAIDEDLALAALVDQAEAAFAEIKRTDAELSATQDPLLGELAEFYLAPVNAARDLAGLPPALATARQSLARWSTFVRGPWENDIDHVRFAAESTAAKETGPVTLERLLRWEEEAKEYTFIAAAGDPRRNIDWTALAADVARALERFRAEERAAPGAAGGASSSAEFQQRADTLARAVATLASARVIRKDAGGLASQVERLADDHRALAERIAGALALLRPDVPDWLRQVREIAFGDSPILQRLWRERIARLIGDTTPAQLAANPARFNELRAQARSLEEFLQTIATPQTLPLATIAADGLDDAVRRQLAEWLAAQRETALNAMLAAIDWNDPAQLASPAVALTKPAVAAAQSRYVDAKHDALGLARDAAELAPLLAAGRGLDEGAAAIAARAEAHPQTSALLQTGPLNTLAAQIAELRTLAAAASIDELAVRAGAGSLAGALAAWRRLGALPDWPRGPADLEREALTAANLRRRLTTADTDPDRQTALAAEFSRAAPLRWRKALRASRTQPDVVAVFARMTEFGLADEAALDEAARYNLYLSQLKADSAAARTVEEAGAARTRFLTRARELTSLAAQPEVASFLVSLESVALAQGDPRADLRKLGPAVRGWSAEPADDARQAVYRWTNPAGQTHTLTFAFVELADTDPFFLATTEAPVGLLLDTAAARAEEKFIATQMPAWIPSAQSPAEDQRQGPQVWAVDFRQKGRLRLNDKWTGVRMPSWPDQIYADAKIAPPPNRLTPAQYLDPDAARIACERLLGCRLPTPAEWTELLRTLGGGTALESLRWNFRDKTWQAQQRHLVNVGAAFDLPWPDADSFVPASAANSGRGKDAVAADSVDDGFLWFANVDAGSPETVPFAHLFGNVAEFLWDPITGKYAVAGGSALSPPEADPAAISAVDSQQEREGYSDVGFRPAFSAPDSLVGKSRLSRLIREQGFSSL